MKILTQARDLRRRKAREHRASFVAEGIRTVEELLRSPLHVSGALVVPAQLQSERAAALVSQFSSRDIPVEEVTPRELASAAETESPQGVLALAEIPQRTPDDIPITNVMRILVLDGVQDPGNVGTIVRTAAALGVAATLAMPGTVDLWNAKVVRSGMGSLFHHLTMACTWDELEAFRKRHGFALWGADAAGERLDTLQAPSRVMLAVGNEGSGLSMTTRERADRMVALPIAAEVESLNVAVATGIILYQLRP